MDTDKAIEINPSYSFYRVEYLDRERRVWQIHWIFVDLLLGRHIDAYYKDKDPEQKTQNAQRAPLIVEEIFLPVMLFEVNKTEPAEHNTGHGRNNKHGQTKQNELEIFHDVIHTFNTPY